MPAQPRTSTTSTRPSYSTYCPPKYRVLSCSDTPAAPATTADTELGKHIKTPWSTLAGLTFFHTTEQAHAKSAARGRGSVHAMGSVHAAVMHMHPPESALFFVSKSKHAKPHQVPPRLCSHSNRHPARRLKGAAAVCCSATLAPEAKQTKTVDTKPPFRRAARKPGLNILRC